MAGIKSGVEMRWIGKRGDLCNAWSNSVNAHLLPPSFLLSLVTGVSFPHLNSNKVLREALE